MPLSGLSVNNPQEQNPITLTNPAQTVGGATYGGNVLGSGSTATSGGGTPNTLGVSTILLYGALALLAIWILRRLEEN